MSHALLRSLCLLAPSLPALTAPMSKELVDNMKALSDKPAT